MSMEAKSGPWEVFRIFSWLGLTAFGGPAAHVALMHRELCGRRKWVDDLRFFDANAFTNLLPGPNSTQLCMIIGYWRAGWLGLWLAGIGFIWPAMIMVAMLAWLYGAWQDMPWLTAVMSGIQAVVLAVIIQALGIWAGKLLKRDGADYWEMAMVASLAILAFQNGMSELVVLPLAALFVIIWRRWQRIQDGPSNPAGLAADALSLSQLFFTFMKIGTVLFGSGYVLFAYLQREFVERLGVLTPTQVADAIAIGQMTPGPLFTSATFVGFITQGWTGALIATAGIFLPAFLVVSLFVRKMAGWREIGWVSEALDGIQVASLAFMGWVTWQWIQPFIGIWWWLAAAALSLLVLWRFPVNSFWVILAGGALGYVLG